MKAVNRNLPFLVVAAMLGAALGVWVASRNPTYQATTTLGVRTSSDVAQSSTVTQSAAYSITSPVVVERAAALLKIDPASLSSQLSARVESGTTLIELTAANEDPNSVIENVTTVADVAIDDYRSRSAAIGEDVRIAGEELLRTGKLTEATAERTRQESIGTVVGTAQGQSIQGTVTLSIVSPALDVSIGGIGRSVGLILGGAFGLLLAILVVLSGGWRNMRKVRSAADLDDAEEIRAAFSSSDVPDVAGTVLETESRFIVVIGADTATRRATADGVSTGLRRNGYSVAQVVTLDAPQQDTPLTRGRGDDWAVGVAKAELVLAKTERVRLAQELSTEIVVVEVSHFADVSAFLAGQTDFVPILNIRRGQRLGAVERDLRPLAIAGPIVVLTD